MLDLANPDTLCNNLPNFPIQSHGASGGVINDQLPFICGGNNVDECYIVGDENMAAKLQEPRKYHASLPMPNVLWLLGKVSNLARRKIKKKYWSMRTCRRIPWNIFDRNCIRQWHDYGRSWTPHGCQ